MSNWNKYRRTNVAEMRPYVPGEDLSRISVSEVDDPPNDRGMIARNPKNHFDQWYVARAYFEENFEPLEAQHSEPGREGLSFAQLRAANVERCESAFHALDHWNPMEWGAACAGEVGEGINAAKKLRRVKDSEQYKQTLPTTDVTLQDVADEIADAVIYADLWAASIGVDLGAAVADKFNRTSEKVQSDVRLAAPALTPTRGSE